MQIFGSRRINWLLALLCVGLLQSCSGPVAREDLPRLEGIEVESLAFQEVYTRLLGDAEKDRSMSERVAALAYLYHANTRLTEAAILYQELAELEPVEAKWPYLVARIEQDFGRTDEAIAFYGKSIELSPNRGITYLRIGDLLLKVGRYEEARSAYNSCLGRGQAREHALLGLGRIAIGERDWEFARSLLLESVAGELKLATAFKLLATAHEALGDQRSAERARAAGLSVELYRDVDDGWLEPLTSYCYNVGKLRTFADVHFLYGEHAKSRELFERALSIDPEDGRTLYGLALVDRALGNRELTRKYVLESIEKDPKLVEARLLWIDVLRESESYNEALSACGEAIAVLPSAAELRMRHGYVLQELKREEDAMDSFRSAIELDPMKHRNLEYLGNEYWKVGAFEKAVPLYEKARRLNMLAVKPRAMLAGYYLGDGKSEEALACAAEAFETDPSIDGIAELVAQCYVEIGKQQQVLQNYDKAANYYIAAFDTDPRSRESLKLLFKLYVNSGRVANAEGVVAELRRKHPRSLPVLEFAAGVETLLGDRDSARSMSREGLRLAREEADWEWIARFETLVEGMR